MTDSLIGDVLEMAHVLSDASEGLLVHSDQGTQYRFNWYQAKLHSGSCLFSMRRSGNSWDIAAMESFFSRLKLELIFGEKFTDIA